MAKTTVVAELVFNALPAMSDQLRERASAVVREAAFAVEARAKTIVPVDTGTLKNSIQAEMLDDLSAQVAPHTDYAIYVEFGTRRMAARPYMAPAAEAVRPAFVAEMKKLL